MLLCLKLPLVVVGVDICQGLSGGVPSAMGGVFR